MPITHLLPPCEETSGPSNNQVVLARKRRPQGAADSRVKVVEVSKANNNDIFSALAVAGDTCVFGGAVQPEQAVARAALRH